MVSPTPFSLLVSPTVMVLALAVSHMFCTIVLRNMGVHSQKRSLLKACLRMDIAIACSLFVQILAIRELLPFSSHFSSLCAHLAALVIFIEVLRYYYTATASLISDRFPPLLVPGSLSVSSAALIILISFCFSPSTLIVSGAGQVSRLSSLFLNVQYESSVCVRALVLVLALWVMLLIFLWRLLDTMLAQARLTGLTRYLLHCSNLSLMLAVLMAVALRLCMLLLRVKLDAGAWPFDQWQPSAYWTSRASSFAAAAAATTSVSFPSVSSSASSSPSVNSGWFSYFFSLDFSFPSVAFFVLMHADTIFGLMAVAIRMHLTLITTLPSFLPLDRSRLVALRHRLLSLAAEQRSLEVSRSNLMSGVVHTSFAALDAHSQTLSDDMQRSLKELEFLVVDVFIESTASTANENIRLVLTGDRRRAGGVDLLTESIMDAIGIDPAAATEILREQRAFLKNVTHCLRTPLHSVITFKSMLLATEGWLTAPPSLKTPDSPDTKSSSFSVGVGASSSSSSSSPSSTNTLNTLPLRQRHKILRSVVHAQNLLRSLENVLELCDLELDTALNTAASGQQSKAAAAAASSASSASTATSSSTAGSLSPPSPPAMTLSTHASSSSSLRPSSPCSPGGSGSSLHRSSSTSTTTLSSSSSASTTFASLSPPSLPSAHQFRELHALLDDVLEAQSFRAVLAQAELVVHVRPLVPPTVALQLDHRRFLQIMGCLLETCLAHTSSGSQVVVYISLLPASASSPSGTASTPYLAPFQPSPAASITSPRASPADSVASVSSTSSTSSAAASMLSPSGRRRALPSTPPTPAFFQATSTLAAQLCVEICNVTTSLNEIEQQLLWAPLLSQSGKVTTPIEPAHKDRTASSTSASVSSGSFATDASSRATFFTASAHNSRASLLLARQSVQILGGSIRVLGAGAGSVPESAAATAARSSDAMGGGAQADLSCCAIGQEVMFEKARDSCKDSCCSDTTPGTSVRIALPIGLRAPAAFRSAWVESFKQIVSSTNSADSSGAASGVKFQARSHPSPRLAAHTPSPGAANAANAASAANAANAAGAAGAAGVEKLSSSTMSQLLRRLSGSNLLASKTSTTAAAAESTTDTSVSSLSPPFINVELDSEQTREFVLTKAWQQCWKQTPQMPMLRGMAIVVCIPNVALQHMLVHSLLAAEATVVSIKLRTEVNHHQKAHDAASDPLSKPFTIELHTPPPDPADGAASPPSTAASAAAAARNLRVFQTLLIASEEMLLNAPMRSVNFLGEAVDAALLQYRLPSLSLCFGLIDLLHYRMYDMPQQVEVDQFMPLLHGGSASPRSPRHGDRFRLNAALRQLHLAPVPMPALSNQSQSPIPTTPSLSRRSGLLSVTSTPSSMMSSSTNAHTLWQSPWMSGSRVVLNRSSYFSLLLPIRVLILIELLSAHRNGGLSSSSLLGSATPGNSQMSYSAASSLSSLPRFPPRSNVTRGRSIVPIPPANSIQSGNKGDDDEQRLRTRRNQSLSKSMDRSLMSTNPNISHANSGSSSSAATKKSNNESHPLSIASWVEAPTLSASETAKLKATPKSASASFFMTSGAESSRPVRGSSGKGASPPFSPAALNASPTATISPILSKASLATTDVASSTSSEARTIKPFESAEPSDVKQPTPVESEPPQVSSVVPVVQESTTSTQPSQSAQPVIPPSSNSPVRPTSILPTPVPVTSAPAVAFLRLIPPAASPLRVLIVDDLPFNQKALHMQLKAALGISVAASTVFEFADDGAQAVQKVQANAFKQPYHVIWMDLQMPVLDGVGAIRAIRDWEQQLNCAQPADSLTWSHHIIAITANNQQDDETRSLSAGANVFVAKPATPAKLKALMSTVRDAAAENERLWNASSSATASSSTTTSFSSTTSSSSDPSTVQSTLTTNPTSVATSAQPDTLPARSESASAPVQPAPTPARSEPALPASPPRTLAMLNPVPPSPALPICTPIRTPGFVPPSSALALAEATLQSIAAAVDSPITPVLTRLTPPPALPLRILIVDDIKFNQKALFMQLKSALGAPLSSSTIFEFADDGAQAVDMVQVSAAKQQPYHVVWMDLLMPVLDGVGAIRVIRDWEHQLNCAQPAGSLTWSHHIIAITANNQQDDETRCLSAGANVFIAKPATPARLKELMSAVREIAAENERLFKEASNPSSPEVTSVASDASQASDSQPPSQAPTPALSNPSPPFAEAVESKSSSSECSSSVCFSKLESSINDPKDHTSTDFAQPSSSSLSELHSPLHDFPSAVSTSSLVPPSSKPSAPIAVPRQRAETASVPVVIVTAVDATPVAAAASSEVTLSSLLASSASSSSSTDRAPSPIPESSLSIPIPSSDPSIPSPVWPPSPVPSHLSQSSVGSFSSMNSSISSTRSSTSALSMLAPPSSSNLRVLIVDDINFNQRALQMQLKGVLGTAVAAATVFDFADDGAQAVQKVQLAAGEGKPYHVIWMDLLMPVLDGVGAIIAIRAWERSLAEHRNLLHGALAVDVVKEAVAATFSSAEDAEVDDVVSHGAATDGNGASSAAGVPVADLWAHFIIAITANNHRNDELRSLQAGANVFVAKPATPAKLKTLMNRVRERYVQLQTRAEHVHRLQELLSDAPSSPASTSTSTSSSATGASSSSTSTSVQPSPCLSTPSSGVSLIVAAVGDGVGVASPSSILADASQQPTLPADSIIPLS